MDATQTKQGTLVAVYPTLRRWMDGFLVARRAAGATPTTMLWYGKRLTHFGAYCDRRNVATLDAIDPGLLCEYLLALEASGHNPGGVHGYYRAVKTFLRWYEAEAAPDGWRNPVKRVPPPKVPEQILEPVELDTVGALVKACDSGREGTRDRAILLTLLDTGARASELCSLELADLNFVSGELIIRQGKGRKPRAVFLGQKTRRVVRAWVRERGGHAGPLFAAEGGGRLSYFGLRSLIQRRAKAASIRPTPSLHSFRRAFAINMLRAGVDLLSLQRLLSHADLSVLTRYNL